MLLAAFASVLSRHARQDVVVVGVEGHPVALACEKNDAFCERVEKAIATPSSTRVDGLTLEDVLEATSTILDRTSTTPSTCEKNDAFASGAREGPRRAATGNTRILRRRLRRCDRATPSTRRRSRQHTNSAAVHPTHSAHAQRARSQVPERPL